MLACSNDLPQATPTSFAVTSSALSVPDVVESTIPSIVQVTVRSEDGSEIGTGTGIVLNDEGFIITNWHVINGSDEVQVTTSNGTLLPASLLREDQSLDLAVLAVVGANLEPATFGDSDSLRVGEDVVSIGHAFGLDGGPSVSKGVVSGLNRTVADRSGNVFSNLIQTDASINLGSSGGALVNSSGEIVGINLGGIDVGQGANFALNINNILDGADRLVQLGKREDPGYLGLGGVDVTPHLAFQHALPVNAGFGIRYVDPQSPAAREFKVDDIIVNIDDTPIRGKRDFTEFLRVHPDGTDVVVTTIRKSGDQAVIMEIPVTLGTRGT